MANVWGAISAAGPGQVPCASSSQLHDPVINLNDVMSEELARSLDSKDDYNSNKTTLTTQLPVDQGACFAESLLVDLPSESPPQCQSDEMLAKLLQTQFDREHDDYISKVQDRTNGSSRVSVSFDNFRRSKDLDLSDSDSDDYDDNTDRKPWDEYERSEKSPAITVGRSGFVMLADGQITTKHDPAICGRKNARRVMDLSGNINMGDGGGMDLKLNNRDYNVLRAYSNKQSKRAAKLHEKKEKSTAESVMDENTRLLLFKMVNNGILDEVNGCINTGKEANVYHGLGGNVEEMVIPGEVAIKVFKTTLNEFKHRDPYIKDDFRFCDRFSTQNPRKVIHLWAEKEKFNLQRLKREGIPCPEVVLLRKHILVMQFIGTDARRAPTLKEANLDETGLERAHKQVIEIMKRMYNKCQMIHADMSEYNLLWHENHVWVIDVSQSVLKNHPNAYKFLHRDCVNISNYFSKKGLPDVLSPSALFHHISGKSVLDANGDFSLELLEKLDDFEKDLELLTIGEPEKLDPFEEMFKRSVTTREQQQAGVKASSSSSSSPPKHLSGHAAKHNKGYK